MQYPAGSSGRGHRRTGAPIITVLLAWGLLAGAGLAAAEPRVEVKRDLPYLGAGRREMLDLYLPAATPGHPRPAVVWIHGGGWTGGTKAEARAQRICSTLAEAGYVAASIDYRLGHDAWPTCLQDARNAVRFLRVNAAPYGIDAERIAVAGGSAGGHLALMVGLTTATPSLAPTGPYPGVRDDVRCIIDLYGPTDLTDRRQVLADGTPTAQRRFPPEQMAVFGAASSDAPVLRVASPLTWVRTGAPPILILHGRADTTVDRAQSEKLVAALAARGVAHEVVFLNGVGHTFDFETWQSRPLPRDLRPVVLEFLKRYLGPPQP